MKAVKDQGELYIVGTGIKSISHITIESKSHIQSSDKLLYVVTDGVTKSWLKEMNSTAEDMTKFYSNKKHREETYLEMAEYSLSFVRKGLKVCVAYYGHPGVFVAPSFLSYKKAKDEGYHVEMLPGISAEDSLFCDLGFDPARVGCQSFEVTDFLVYNRKFDPRCNLILWQIGVIAKLDYQLKYEITNALDILIAYLKEFYPLTHKIVLYEAPMFKVCNPVINIFPLQDLSKQKMTPISTLYIPPCDSSIADVNMVTRLNIPEEYCNRDRKNNVFIASSTFDPSFFSLNEQN
jgi:uroporphyrin-III C-methyltransferase